MFVYSLLRIFLVVFQGGSVGGQGLKGGYPIPVFQGGSVGGQGLKGGYPIPPSRDLGRGLWRLYAIQNFFLFLK